MKQSRLHRFPHVDPSALRRRALLGGSLGLALAVSGCAHLPPEAATIRNGSTGAWLSFAELQIRIQASNFVMLGEQHDNPAHHQVRGQLMASLPRPVTVVAEHLPRGAAPALPEHADPVALLEALERSGFDAKGWRWPLHQALFTAIAQRRHRLRGGNLPRQVARQAAREGMTALPEDLRRLVEAAPLHTFAEEALLAELQAGHCGQLPAQRLPTMLVAQRGRDAAMAAALRDARSDAIGAPVLLLAGNGHVRRDVGVPQLLSAVEPGANVLSVGLIEEGDTPPPGWYDILCTTPRVDREDPCAGLQLR